MIDKLSWIAVYPEIVLLTMACVIALVDLGVKTPQRTLTYVLTLLTLAVVAAMEAAYAVGGQTFYGFGNMVVSDPMGGWLKCFACITLMITLVYGRPYAADRDMLRGGEFFTLSLFALLGMFVMISAGMISAGMLSAGTTCCLEQHAPMVPPAPALNARPRESECGVADRGLVA